jgi:hypothetical protein
MNQKFSPHQHHQLMKTGYLLTGMMLSVLFTKIADQIFPPEPVVVHTVIDSVKIVHEHRKKDMINYKADTTSKSSYEHQDKQP